jgi:hypothetical protein
VVADAAPVCAKGRATPADAYAPPRKPESAPLPKLGRQPAARALSAALLESAACANSRSNLGQHPARTEKKKERIEKELSHERRV